MDAPPQVAQRAFVAATAATSTSQQDAAALFDWAQVAYPLLFAGPYGQDFIELPDVGAVFYRYWAQTGNYAGVANGRVYVYGPLSNMQLQDVGAVDDYHCVAVRCDGAGGVGATLSYQTYEAEALAFRGSIIGPTRAAGEMASEASGRRAVQLSETGDYVELRTTSEVNSIVVRYAIPDLGPQGHVTLGLYVDGTRVKDLQLTSRYTWLYGGYTNSVSKNPADGGPHRFFDETHELLQTLPAGTKIRLKKDASDSAAFYVIDLIDLENVAPPAAQPTGSLSITSFGAIPNDGLDDGTAIQRAIDAAKIAGKPLWIPAGAFDMKDGALSASGVTIHGAGMWHSLLRGPLAHIELRGNDNTLSDFALSGDITARDDLGALEDGIRGPVGTGSSFTNLWIEHTKAGIWVAESDATSGLPSTSGLVAHGLRIRNTIADGMTLCCSTSNSVIEQSSFRGTGDDAMASWSLANPARNWPRNTGNIFRFNTVQAVWKANCFAVYGGGTIEAHDNYCADTASYSGFRIAAEFDSTTFDGTVTLRNNSIIRAGGYYGGGINGALTLIGQQASLATVVLDNLLIQDSTVAGLQLQGPFAFNNLSASNVLITGSGTYGIWFLENSAGTLTANSLVVEQSALANLRQDPGANVTFMRGAGNSGW